MAVEFTVEKSTKSLPIYLIGEGEVVRKLESMSALNKTWLEHQNFTAKAGEFILLPDKEGNVSGAVFGLGSAGDPFVVGLLAKVLPAGDWHFLNQTPVTELQLLALAMGSYRFERFLNVSENRLLKFFCPNHCDIKAIKRLYQSVKRTRDLINMPANEMTPREIENSAHALTVQYGVKLTSIIGDDLLAKNFPLIHAVGRGSNVAPRLIEFCWGREDAPKVTLVGKGVSFDSGGLDLKSSANMSLMKKDMGGAANVLGLAELIMDAGLNVRLRVIIPAVENAISGDAFRPGDIIKSRKGLTVEIGNTDAEGRLILADALSYACEDKPQILIDIATLTGAARIALGPDLPPFFTNDDRFADDLMRCSSAVHDPLWRLPLWSDYLRNLSSTVADINNVTKDGFAGSISAALFLSRFVEGAQLWCHLDIYGWTPTEKPAFPAGGEAQSIRALYHYLKERFS